tara:strand:+ start:478 stop:1164 length:687 start_codon:yes stop_codon:yes gene_type:complete
MNKPKTMVTTSGGNRKLGACVASTARRVGTTCPGGCALLPHNAGPDDPVCYAHKGLMRFHPKMIEKHGVESTAGALQKANGVPLIRHLTGGDWLRPTSDGRRVVDRDHARDVIKWHGQRSQRYTLGWSYTHAPEQLDRAGFGPSSWPANLSILASVDTIDKARELQSKGWHTARVVETPKHKARNETLCPYDLAKHNGKDPDVTCASCRLCLPGQNKNIAFVALKGGK